MLTGDPIRRYVEHAMLMDLMHWAWETINGVPCGPPDPRSVAKPRGLLVDVD